MLVLRFGDLATVPPWLRQLQSMAKAITVAKVKVYLYFLKGEIILDFLFGL